MTFRELLRLLGYAEAHCGFPYAFHGCLSHAVSEIVQEGLAVRPGEPSLTYNAASSLLKYANPALNSAFVYGGGLSGRIARLVNAKALSPKPEDTLFIRAMQYWRDDPASGAAFVFDVTKAQLTATKEGQIQLNANVVSGGISKWIYCHMSCTSLPKESIIGMLRPSGRWEDCFRLFHPLRQERIPLSSPVASLLSDPALFVPLQEVCDFARCLTESLSLCLLYQEVRKLFLSILQAKGCTIAKTNPGQYETWVFFAPEPALTHMRKLRYEDEKIHNTKENLVTALQSFFETT